jgi:signal transduction histidine kinase
VLAPFGRADTTLSRSYEGAGLGLTLASALTHSMEGEFEIDSAQGEGTTIEMRFPAHSSTAATAEPMPTMWLSE